MLHNEPEDKETRKYIYQVEHFPTLSQRIELFENYPDQKRLIKNVLLIDQVVKGDPLFILRILKEIKDSPPTEEILLTQWKYNHGEEEIGPALNFKSQEEFKDKVMEVGNAYDESILEAHKAGGIKVGEMIESLIEVLMNFPTLERVAFLQISLWHLFETYQVISAPKDSDMEDDPEPGHYDA